MSRRAESDTLYSEREDIQYSSEEGDMNESLDNTDGQGAETADDEGVGAALSADNQVQSAAAREAASDDNRASTGTNDVRGLVDTSDIEASSVEEKDTKEDAITENNQEENDADDAVASLCEEFLSKLDQWKTATHVLMTETAPPFSISNEPCAQGRPAILEAMYSNKQVQLHSLKSSPAKNGLIGNVVRYTFGTDRFHVETMQGESLALHARNLKIVGDDNISDEAPLTTTSDLAEALFQPGMLFAGTICIPGLLSEAEQERYQLIVESTSSLDELGRPMGILARHKAYDDEQYVWIQLERDDNDETALSIRYADGETQCHGKWNDEKRLFEGTVHQLLPTEDGGSVYHTRDEVSHTFTLTPTTVLHSNGIATVLETKPERPQWKQDLISPLALSILRLRQQTQQLSFDLVNLFHRVCQTLTSSTEPDTNGILHNDFHRLIEQVDWQDMLTVNSLAGERTCAKFRRWAQLFDSLSFECIDERVSTLSSLHAKGITRALAHAESDDCKESARDLFAAWCALSAFSPRRASRPGSMDMNRMFSICARLERNFARFDGALRRAEERLTNTEISHWSVPPSRLLKDGQEDDALCTICHVELLSDEAEDDIGKAEVLRLPCSHAFHGQCLREWLHHHSQCPLCRYNLES